MASEGSKWWHSAPPPKNPTTQISVLCSHTGSGQAVPVCKRATRLLGWCCYAGPKGNVCGGDKHPKKNEEICPKCNYAKLTLPPTVAHLEKGVLARRLYLSVCVCLCVSNGEKKERTLNLILASRHAMQQTAGRAQAYKTKNPPGTPNNGCSLLFYTTAAAAVALTLLFCFFFVAASILPTTSTWVCNDAVCNICVTARPWECSEFAIRTHLLRFCANPDCAHTHTHSREGEKTTGRSTLPPVSKIIQKE